MTVSPFVALGAAACVLGELMAVRSGTGWVVGGVRISPLLVPAALVAVSIGWPRPDPGRLQFGAWARWWCVGLLLLGVTGVAWVARSGTGTTMLGIVLAAAEEELVFRLALPIAAGYAVAALLGRPASHLAAWGAVPRIAAIATATVVFAVQPGHLAQAHAWYELAPFLSFGLLLGYVALRTAAVLPGVLLHAILNVAALAHLDGVLPYAFWAVVVVLALWTYGRSAERAGRGLGLVSARS